MPFRSTPEITGITGAKLDVADTRLNENPHGSRTVQTMDRTPLILHGVDPTQRKLIALKSNHHFRSGFEAIAAAIVTTDPPGVTTHDVTAFSRRRCPRPMFPLDPEARYPRGEVLAP